jgi:dTDP-4-amino-4,6-dideoxygalactose transaminase
MAEHLIRGPVRHLTQTGVSTVLNYPKALPFYPAYIYLGHAPRDFPVAYFNQSRILSLPIYPETTDDMISHMAGKIAEFFRGSPQLNRGFVKP